MTESQGPPTFGGEGEPQGPQPVQPAVPAAWYPHPTAPGWEAYWDGAAWGPETRPAQQAAPAVPPVQEQPVQEVQPAAVEPQPAVQTEPVEQAAQEQPTAVQPEPAPQAGGFSQSQVSPAAAATAAAAAPAAAAERSGSSLAPIFCILGAVVAIVGSFLPMATTDLPFDIADNTLVAAGYGIAVIAAAVIGAIIAAYCYVKATRTWLPILLGVVIVGIAAYVGLVGLDDLTPEVAALPEIDPKAAGEAPRANGAGATLDPSPSTGIFTVGIGGLLMMLGGIGIAREPS